jgi:hypothetical protein
VDFFTLSCSGFIRPATGTTTMNISCFDDLLTAAREQPEPQRLLFVFAGAELADDSTPEQRERFDAGEGGALVPMMSVDKSPDDIVDFQTLANESQQFDKPWVLVFVAALSGRNGAPALAADVDQALERMTEAIRTGSLSAFIPFDREGQTVQFS